MDAEKSIMEKLSEQIREEIDSEMLKGFLGIDMEEPRTLPDNKAVVDPEYLHKIKTKVEKILLTMIEEYKLQEFMSEKYRYRLSLEKLYASKYHELFGQQKDINGIQLRRGHEYIPEDFESWLRENLPDYMETELIYTEMCKSRRIIQKDLKYLNDVAKKHKVNNE